MVLLRCSVHAERMGEASFGSIVTQVQADGTPNSGNVKAMVHDVDNYVRQVEGIDDGTVRVRRTVEAACLIRAQCRAAEGSTLAHALDGLREVWLTDLAYPYLEAHELTVSQDFAVLQFVTQIGPTDFYVTGRIDVSPPEGR